ncbi:hypothetical protein GGI42DRAFT_337088 [Trichoderma sp. SZMC 28013]
MPCTCCYRAKLPCVMSGASSRCGNCVTARKSCDGVLVSSSLERVLAQRRALERQEEDTGDQVESLNAQMIELQAQLAEALGRLSRIRKTRKKPVA